jgi:hypothetical protein
MPVKYPKICLVHSMPIGSHMFDFLMNKSIAEGRYSYNRHYGEYWASECEYVKRFLKENDDYIYVGSSDDFLKKPKIPWGFKRIIID